VSNRNCLRRVDW